MGSRTRILTLAPVLALALLLGNCSNFDPTDMMDDLFSTPKKPLPGERKELFPGGTPGVSQGLPPELVKGYQPPPPDTSAQAAPDQSKPKAKAKPKPASDPSSASASTPQAAQSVTR